MPNALKGQKRPADLVSNANKIDRTVAGRGPEDETWERNFHRSDSMVLTILAYLFGRTPASK